MNIQLTNMKQWSVFGAKLDNIYYKPDDTIEQLKGKLEESYKLFNEINSYRVSQTYRNNFLTDLIHILARLTCIRKDGWIKSFEKDFQRKFHQLELNP